MNVTKCKMIGNVNYVKAIISEVVSNGGKIKFDEFAIEIMSKRNVCERTAKEYIKTALFQLRLKKNEISA